MSAVQPPDALTGDEQERLEILVTAERVIGWLGLWVGPCPHCKTSPVSALHVLLACPAR
jgi:hypothetical protein